VKVPRETTGLTAGWVGEGSPKPLTKGALDTVTLGFNKVAAICVLTQELLRFSTPSAEAMVRDRLVKAITYKTDRDFLDPSVTAVTGVNPASITNGASTVASTGLTADAFRNDFAALLVKYTQANYNLDSLVLIMTQTQALRLALMKNDFGVRDFPNINKDGGSIEGIPVVVSENIVANGGSPADGAIIVALNASDVLLADDGGVEIDVSTEASVQMETAPDSPQTASTVYASFWQRNLVGIRAERFITWTKARTDSVVYITGANYRSM
jgi:HK97 family phage major capsid protein